MSARDRREKLLAWMRERAPCRIREVFLQTPLELYVSYFALQRDLQVLKREGRVRLAGSKWVVV